MCQKGRTARLIDPIYENPHYDNKVDECLLPFLQWANDNGFATVASCCGHEQSVPYVTAMMDPGRLDEFLGKIEEMLDWKGLRGFSMPAFHTFEANINPARGFDFKDKVEVGVYAYAGYEEEYAESMAFSQPFR